jgi:exonuclease III
MKLFYWNIDRSITSLKNIWIEKVVDVEQPDILCIAEGPESIVSCNDFVDNICNKGYSVYYSPTFYKNSKILEQYGWNKLGLKVFVKLDVQLKSRFAFGNQRLEGRVIYLRYKENSQYYSIFLIHGMSKVGDDIDQNNFICELSSFIRTKILDKVDDHVIIMGDFNIEPWDELVKHIKYINSFFYPKLFNYHSPKLKSRVYYNPIFDYIQKHSDSSLIGTFYNDTYISIFDYVLLSKGFDNYEFNILTKIGVDSLLKEKKRNHILVDNLDHLPITLKIK